MVHSKHMLYAAEINPHTPVAQKIADEVDDFFLNRTSLTPPQIFDVHLLENTNLSPSSFHFSVGLYQDLILSQIV